MLSSALGGAAGAAGRGGGILVLAEVPPVLQLTLVGYTDYLGWVMGQCTIQIQIRSAGYKD